MFHFKDGLCFERIKMGEKYGSVRLCRLRANESMVEGAGETLGLLS